MVESIFFNPWIWIVGVLFTVSLAVSLFLLWKGVTYKSDNSYDEPFGWYMGAGFVGAAALLLAGGWFGAMLPPYDASFYQTYRITGELTQLEAAFSGDEGTMSQVFVAKVDGVDEFIRSDDQRFRALEAGDDVNLVCSKQFRYFQEAWYECAFGGAR